MSIRSKIFVLLLSLLTSLCFADRSFAKERFRSIHISDLEAMQAKGGGVTLLDANVEGTRTGVGLIRGARPLSSHDRFAQSELPSDLGAPLVFYCANTMCTASHIAAERAIGFGYKNVSVMVDGVYGWQKAGKPLDPYKKAPENKPETKQEAKEITPLEAKKLLEQGQAVVLDVREQEERHEIIGRSQWFPMSKFKSGDWDKFVSSLKTNQTVIVHCAAGIRSKKVAEYLAANGYSALYFKGPDQWKAAGLPLEAGPAH